jgi:DNA-binding IclR family transcriptional regulator
METVTRALEILKSLATGPLRVQDIVDRLGVHKSTASRLLATLRQHGFVRLNNRREYELGYAVFELAHALREMLDVRTVARPHLEALWEIIGETIHLAVLDGTEIVYLDKIDSRHPVRMYSRVGKRASSYCTGVGKAILAYLPPKELEQTLKAISFKRFTERTITDPMQLAEELAQVRSCGIAWDRGEHEPEIYCIGAPIFDFSDQVVAGISISVTTSRNPVEVLDGYKELLSKTAQAVSRDLGYVKAWPPKV